MADEDDSISAGRIELEVVADLGAGWGKKLQNEVNTELKGVKARIRAEIDAAVVEVQAKAAAEAAERVAKIRMQVEIDNAAARTALSGLSGSQTVTVRADVDDATARAQLADLGRDTKTTIRPEVDDADAQARIAALEQQLAQLMTNGNRRIPVSVNVQGTAALGQAMTMLAQVPFMVSGLAVLASTAISAGSGLFALAAGATQAVGALGALPSLAGAAVQGLGTMLLGLSGVREAVNALSSAQASGGQSAAAYAAAQEAAAERIKQAQRAIRDANHARMLASERTADAKEAAQAAADAIVEAEQRVADAVAAVGEARARVAEVAEQAAERQEDAAYRVEQAERRYAEAQRASQRATEALNDARKAAKERLEDLELAVRGGALDEEGAALAVERAKQRLDKVVGDPFASDLDKKEADLAYRQALQRLAEVRERNGDLRDEQAEANAKGVEGSDQVTAAKERIAAAAQAERDAEHALAEAREDAARAAVEGARAIEQAQRGVSEAMKRVRDAEKDVEQAKKAEVRARRDVREALWNEMLANERLADAKKELIKAQKAAAQAAQQQGAGMSAVAKAMDNLSPAGQRFARFVAGTLQPRMKELRFAVQEALLPPLQEAIRRGLPMLDTLEVGLADTGREIGEVAKEWGKWVGSKEFRTDLGKIMKSNTKIVGIFGRAGKSAFKGVMDILVTSIPSAEKLAGWIERSADKFAEWTGQARKDGSMARFFDNGLKRAKQLWGIVKNVSAGIYELAKIAAPSGGTLLDDLSEGSKEFREWASDPANQEKIRKFFEDSVVVLRALGRLLKGVVDLLFTLTNTVGGETLAGFVDTLTTIVGWLDKLAEHPVAGEIIKWTLYLSGVALAIGLIIGKVTSLIKVFGRIPGVTKLVKALADQVGKLVGLLGKVTGLGKLPTFGGGGGGKDGKDGKGPTAVGTMRVTAGTVIVNGKTTGTGSSGKTGTGKTGTGDSGKTTTPTPTGKTGKTGKGGTAAKIGGGAAGVGLAVASMFGADWINEVVAKAEQHLGKTGAGAAKGAINGGLIGSVVGPIGSLIGAVYGAVNGAVKGAGGNTTAAALGSLVSGPLGLAAGLIPSPEEAVKKLAPTIVAIKKNWADMWTALTGQTNTNSTALNSKIGTFTSGAASKFVTLKQNAPQHVKDTWAAIQADINAGLPPSQAKIDAFVKAGGTSFLDLKRDAPLAMHGMLADIQNHAAASLPITSQKFADFVQKGNLKFAELKAGAPKSLQDAWKSIQTDAAAGLPPSKAKIDQFIKDGGLAFVKLKKDAPAEAKAAWKGVTDSTTTGLAPAKKGVFDATAAMEKAFSTAKAGIGKIWGALPDSLKTPIRWVVNSAYATIKRMWNGIAGAVGLPGLPDVSVNFARGGEVQAARGHGVLPGYSPGRDTMLAAVSPGESWLRPELTRALGSGFIDGGNRAARVGGVTGAARFLAGSGMAFAKGGTVGKSGKTPKKGKELSPLEKLLQGVSAAVRNVFSKGLGAGARATLNPIKNAIVGAIGDRTALQRLIGAIPRKVIDAVIAKFDSKDSELNRDRGGPLPPGRSLVNNGTGKDEWALTPAALAALGGPKAVQALNERGAAALYRGARSASRPVPVATSGGDGRPVTVIVQPQRGQDEVAIAAGVARRVGALVGSP
ncbi:hypothetical protein [Nonomuraea basaltis]|uniref:hypothetical protein n=1 Tax=Nonomuraea basaltis TaxID=2495887 RepID=UPI0014868FA8|nr:hypothetical protein [Nonomuraea basaltis]